ncbi:FBD-associated F-box protein [Raphanus sativus]|uniref:FBD-associated F-box protein At3g49020 n=1 Tax=Raphanus sativus TaxID=3726 RepID=A0A6J0N0E7_RAPSA|nr:FBD-associated F-box protein At3g49020 [Raphanus sativus]KAJ4902920.1 FBD-associated F-box protein [Raphanus sativus]
MAPRKSNGEGKAKPTTVTTPTRQTRSMDRKTRSQTQRNSSGGSSSSSSKLMTFESPEKKKKIISKAKEAGPTTKKIKQEKEEDEEPAAEVAKRPEEEEGDDPKHKKIVIEHCETGGGSLRKVSEDRISELPEALLLHILSSVPTKDVIATSVLSKRWRSLWKMVPKLRFKSDVDHVSSEDVYRLLILHKAPFLESLHLEIDDTSARLDIGILIGIAFSHHVRELELDFYHKDQKKVRFPSVLCSYNNTLEVLKLEFNVLLDFPSRVCFNALRELHLYQVEFKDEASVCNLLSGCPRLQDLVVIRYIGNFDAETYTIAVPSLQRLTIVEDRSTYVDGGGYLINAPSLKYLNIQSLSYIDFCLMENPPEELVEAKIGRIPHIANENIIASLTTAKRLSLYLPLEIKFPTGSIFYQLVFLDLDINKIVEWNLLSLMLDGSPKLQSLKLHSPYREDFPVGWEWNQPKCVPECLLLHLETLVWTNYKCQREEEKQVATYILKNARQLKKATFSPMYINPKRLEQLEKRREMLNEWASVIRASTSCHLVFESR